MKRWLIQIGHYTMLINLFKWLKPIFEGDDGKASWKRILIFILTAVIIWMIKNDLIKDMIKLQLVATIFIVILLLGAVIEFGHVVRFVTKFKYGKDEPSYSEPTKNIVVGQSGVQEEIPKLPIQ